MTITERVLAGLVLVLVGIIPIVGIKLGFGILLVGGGLLIIAASASYQQIPPDPPSFAVPTLWDRRLGMIIKERIAFAFPYFPIFEKLIIMSRQQKNENMVFTGVRCRAGPDPAAPNDPEGTAPQSGGSVKVSVAVTYEPDISSGSRAHFYINSGKEPGVKNILNDMLGEVIRREGSVRTWEEMTFAKQELSVELIVGLTGLQPTHVVLRDQSGTALLNFEPDAPKYQSRKRTHGDILQKEDYELFLDSIVRNGLSDIRGLGIRVRRLNVIEIQPEGELGKDSDGAAREQQQRRSERWDFETETHLAGIYLEEAKKRGEVMTLKEALEMVRLRRNPNSHEAIVRSSGNPFLDAAALFTNQPNSGGRT